MSEKRIAVLVANNRYPKAPELNNLQCPENDVDGLNEILGSKELGNFIKPDVLKNHKCHEVLRTIKQVLKQAEKDDLVLIYYSGHGKVDSDGKLYLTTFDTRVDELEFSSVPVEMILTFARNCRCKNVVLILDCCFSGATRASISGQNGIYIMPASTEFEVAKEPLDESEPYSFFTKHFIQGIREGYADRDGDCYVTINELQSYVRKQLTHVPPPYNLSVDEEIVISRSGKAPSVMEPSWGELVSKRCDRIPQFNKFKRAFKREIQNNLGRPQLYLIHGNDKECHNSLVQRFINEIVKKVAEKQFDKHENIINFKKIFWSDYQKFIEPEKDLAFSHFEEFDPVYMGDLTADALSHVCSSKENPVIVFQHEIRASRWNGDTKNLIKWYIDSFWGNLKRNTKPQFVIFLNIIYPALRPNDCWKIGQIRMRLKKYRIQRELRAIFSSQNDDLILDELLPVTLDDVKDWFSLHYSSIDEGIWQERAEQMFRLPNGLLAKSKNMSEIELHLESICEELRKKKGLRL